MIFHIPYPYPTSLEIGTVKGCCDQTDGALVLPQPQVSQPLVDANTPSPGVIITPAIMRKFPDFDYYLNENAAIISNKNIDNGIIKVLKQRDDLLTTDEMSAIKEFKCQTPQIEVNDSSDKSEAQLIL